MQQETTGWFPPARGILEERAQSEHTELTKDYRHQRCLSSFLELPDLGLGDINTR